MYEVTSVARDPWLDWAVRGRDVGRMWGRTGSSSSNEWRWLVLSFGGIRWICFVLPGCEQLDESRRLRAVAAAVVGDWMCCVALFLSPRFVIQGRCQPFFRQTLLLG